MNKNNEQDKYFYCYSPKLRRFITSNGISWVDKGINENSGYPYWMFTRGTLLNKIVQKYK